MLSQGAAGHPGVTAATKTIRVGIGLMNDNLIFLGWWSLDHENYEKLRIMRIITRNCMLMILKLLNLKINNIFAKQLLRQLHEK